VTIPIKQKISSDINRVAETQFYLRPLLKNSLKSQVLTDAGKAQVGNFNNYLEYWEATFGRQFYDMSVAIRLGTVIENGLKHYYMGKKSHQSLSDLKADPNYKQNIFQRIQSWNGNDSAINLYQIELSIDLTQNNHLTSMQEAMLHRHLYAHNSGLIDDQYIQRLKTLTGTDLNGDPRMQGYPNDDVYWFSPLEKLSEFIEEARRFFEALP